MKLVYVNLAVEIVVVVGLRSVEERATLLLSVTASWPVDLDARASGLGSGVGRVEFASELLVFVKLGGVDGLSGELEGLLEMLSGQLWDWVFREIGSEVRIKFLGSFDSSVSLNRLGLK